MTSPSHPGPRPPSYRFPFELARQAQQALADELDDLDATARAHDDAADATCRRWHGLTATGFATAMSGCLDELAGARGAMARALEELEAAIEQAQGAAARREEQIADHDAAMRRWRQAQDQQASAGGHHADLR